MIKVNYFQVYNNCEGDLLVLPESNPDTNRRKGLPRGAIPCDCEIRSAEELEAVRSGLEYEYIDRANKYLESIGEKPIVRDVAVMFHTTLI